MEFVFNRYSGVVKMKAQKRMNSREIALNKRDDGDILFEEKVSRNLLPAINDLNKQNLLRSKKKMLLDVEKCIQDTHKILMKSLLRSNKLDEFSTE